MTGKEKMISKIAMVAVSLALIRTIAECFRLDYISKHTITFEELRPFLIGSLICSVSCLCMCILYFYSRFKIIIGIAGFTIIILLILKFRFPV
jgi:hypothetical protein